VEEDGSLGSGEDQAAVAELAHTQGLLDAGDDDVQYQFRSGEGGWFTFRSSVLIVGHVKEIYFTLKFIFLVHPL
jgi:hypothetical protein